MREVPERTGKNGGKEMIIHLIQETLPELKNMSRCVLQGTDTMVAKYNHT